MMDLDGKLQEYLYFENAKQPDKCVSLAEDIHGIICGIDMLKEIGLEKGCTVEDVVEKIDMIYDYVSDLKDAMIKDGLHIMG